MPPRITKMPTTGGGGGGGGEPEPSVYAELDGTYSTGHEAMFAFKEFLKANGHTVNKTCTGAAFSAGTDLLTTAASLNASGVFFVAVADSGQQYLFRRLTTSRDWNIAASASGVGFTGGGVGTPPSQADAGVGRLSDVGPFPATGSFDMNAGVEDQSPRRWWMRSEPTYYGADGIVVSMGTPTAPLMPFTEGGDQAYMPTPNDTATNDRLIAMLRETIRAT